MKVGIKGLGKFNPRRAHLIGKRFLRPGDIAIDVGAADGTDAAAWARLVGPTGRVIAIEPHPDGVARLCDAVAPYPWVTCLNVALGPEVGMTSLYLHPLRPKCSSLIRGNVPDGQDVPVWMTTLDRVVADLPRPPRLIKMDAQGAEGAILRGATQTLRSPIVWVLELWPAGLAEAGTSVRDLLQPFRTRGYVPTNMRGVSLRWATARRLATHQPGPSCTDILLVPKPVQARAA